MRAPSKRIRITQRSSANPLPSRCGTFTTKYFPTRRCPRLRPPAQYYWRSLINWCSWNEQIWIKNYRFYRLLRLSITASPCEMNSLKHMLRISTYIREYVKIYLKTTEKYINFWFFVSQHNNNNNSVHIPKNSGNNGRFYVSSFL